MKSNVVIDDTRPVKELLLVFPTQEMSHVFNSCFFHFYHNHLFYANHTRLLIFGAGKSKIKNTNAAAAQNMWRITEVRQAIFNRFLLVFIIIYFIFLLFLCNMVINGNSISIEMICDSWMKFWIICSTFSSFSGLRSGKKCFVIIQALSDRDSMFRRHFIPIRFGG